MEKGQWQVEIQARVEVQDEVRLQDCEIQGKVEESKRQMEIQDQEKESARDLPGRSQASCAKQLRI